MQKSGVHRFLDVSTKHIPKDQIEYMNRHASNNELHRHKHDFGWIVYVKEDNESLKIPDWLRPIFNYAYNNQCAIIVFDSSAELLIDLHNYDQ